MIINLNEISDQGSDFEYTRQDTEMTEALDDLVKGLPFDVSVRITPAGNAFDMRGSVKTMLPETCSFCASDFHFPVDEKFHELILIGTKTRCDIKGTESDFQDPDLEATNLDGYNYDLGAAIHEQIALAEPFQPICKSDCKGLCLTCGADLNMGQCACTHDQKDIKNEKPNVFSVLKDLKLN